MEVIDPSSLHRSRSPRVAPTASYVSSQRSHEDLTERGSPLRSESLDHTPIETSVRHAKRPPCSPTMMLPTGHNVTSWREPATQNEGLAGAPRTSTPLQLDETHTRWDSLSNEAAVLSGPSGDGDSELEWCGLE